MNVFTLQKTSKGYWVRFGETILLFTKSYTLAYKYLQLVDDLELFSQYDHINNPNTYRGEGVRFFFLDYSLGSLYGEFVIYDNNCILASSTFYVYGNEKTLAKKALDFLNEASDKYFEMYYYEITF